MWTFLQTCLGEGNHGTHFQNGRSNLFEVIRHHFCSLVGGQRRLQGVRQHCPQVALRIRHQLSPRAPPRAFSHHFAQPMSRPSLVDINLQATCLAPPFLSLALSTLSSKPS